MDPELILLIIAFILLVLSAIGVGSRFNLQSAGLACIVASMLIPMIAG